jgi:endonuclease V-like protein UPF0215 family
VKPGVRALGVAESFRDDRSTLAGVVVRASRVVDGVAFADCTVGGTDATAAVVELWDRMDREDVRYLLVAGIAPAWYNVLDLREIHAAVDRPVVSVTFEDSEGLAPSIRREFDGEAADERLAVYRAQPDRRRVTVNDQSLYYRPVGLADDESRDLLRAFTPEGGRPEPLRVARLAARGADEFRRRAPPSGESDRDGPERSGERRD